MFKLIPTQQNRILLLKLILGKQNKLLTLVLSPETAKRLFLNTQNKYPERFDNWLLEKTILDLERDRRAY